MDRFFNVPVDLEHALTVVGRIQHILLQSSTEASAPRLSLERLARIEERLQGSGTEDEIRLDAAVEARLLVGDLQLEGMKSDRMGQRMWNLFELLGLGKEGAEIGLLCGENPNSLQRP